MRVDWARSIRRQCESAGVPFFFKQWGGVRKHENGRELDGRFGDAMPVVAAHLTE
jgi:protein gp37